MEFILGCNYWASNAGADMWRAFDLACVDKDIKTLSENGVKHVRVFPNWRDFQPAEPLLSGGGAVCGYTVRGRAMADNPYYLDGVMMDRFAAFLEVCEKYGVRVIVGLITGWMSGGLFVPTALYGENVISSMVAHHFEQLFIKGFVERFRDRDIILAWDLGNECNCTGRARNRYEIAAWVAMISNAIRASDPDRPIISGMHELGVADKKWTISDQTLFLDMLTTHPYPFWCQFTSTDETLSLRTTLHATAQTKLYAEIGGKPCLAEEIGTMGPMVCSDQNAADFLRVNLFSLWANGASGVMWWCAHDQTELESFPYSVQMVERELGMLNIHYEPKPVLAEMSKFSRWLDGLDFELPKAQTDAVCVLTRHQEHWGIGYMTYILSRMAGLNIAFAYGDEPLPESKLYLLPSINGVQVLPKARYEELRERIRDGADVYISIDNAILSDFESLSGLRVMDSYNYPESGTANVGGQSVPFTRQRTMRAEPTTAYVLAYDNENRPFLTVNRYGEGRVFFVNAPIEKNLIDRHNAFDGNSVEIYRALFDEHRYPVTLSEPSLIMTCHPTEDGAFVVILNHYGEEKTFTVETDAGYKLDKVYYGTIGKISPYDACVFKIVKDSL